MKCNKCGKEAENQPKEHRGKKHLSCGGRIKGSGKPRKDLGKWE